MKKSNKSKYQNGGQVFDWSQLYSQYLQNQNGQITNQLPLQGNTFPEVQVTAQSPGQRPPMGYQEPQPLPINNQVQAQPFQQSQLPYQGGFENIGGQEPQSQGMPSGASGVAGGIAQGAYVIGDTLDFLGNIKKGFIKAGAGILNSLIADNPNERQRATQFADNQNRYGTGYDVLYKNGGTLSVDKAKEMLKDGTAQGKKLTAKQKRYFGWIAGGGKAEDGATVQEYGFGEQPQMTPQQAAALNQFIPYPAPQPQPINQPGSFSKTYGTPITGGNTYAGTNYSGQMWGDYSKIGAPIPGQFDPYGQSYLPNPTGGYRINQNALAKMQFGGVVNNTGYLDNAPTAQNAYNVIPSNHITTQNMNQPILANGVPLFPNTGDYMFNESPVLEEKYKVGQELDLDEKTIKRLKSMGYEFE